MKKILIILAVVIVVAVMLLMNTGKKNIVVCSSMEQFRTEEMEKQLAERFPDKNITVTYMPTGKAASKVYAEGKNTEIDILVGLETGYLNKLQDKLAEVKGITTIPYQKDFTLDKNKDKWLTWEKQAGAIVVNREVLAKYNLPMPTCYADLLKPEYKDLVVMPDPKSSGTGYFFFKSWVNTMGEEKALAYVDQLHNNLKAFTESGSGPIKMLKQGEVAIGLALTFQAVLEKNDGQPFEIIFPETGSPYSLTGTAMLRGRESNKDIQEVYAFIVNEFIKYDKEHFSPETIYENQVNKIPNYPQNIPYADMEGIQDNDVKERLLAVWKY